MKRLLLGIGCGLLLACGGLVEELAESATGGEIDIRSDGIELDPPGEGRVAMDWGAAARHPDELDISPPPQGTIQLSGIVTSPDEPDASFAVYGCSGGEDEHLAYYRRELSAKGLEVTEGTDDKGNRQLLAVQGDVVYVVSVGADPEGNAEVLVTLGKGPEEGLEQGLGADPR